MFQLRYTANELRRRLGRTIVTALGLAAGVGLVIGIVGVSQGLDEAQDKVLAPLTSIGTDVLVTRVAGAQDPNASPAPSAQPQQRPQRGGGFFAGPPGGAGAQANQADTAALLNENSTVLTDLSKLGNPGETFTHDFFLSGTFLSFPQDALAQITDVEGVASATAGLTQLASHQTGTVPQIVAEIQTGGQTVEQVVAPEPMTDEESAAAEACFQDQPRPSTGAERQPGQGQGRARFDDCLPARFREYRAKVQVPLQTIRQAVNPPSTNIQSTSYTAAGIDPSSKDSGLVTAKQLTDGAWLSAETDVLANVAYANKGSLKVGSTIPINGTTYTVVGIVNPTLTGNTADLYFPLATLQKMAGRDGRITQILVKASDAGEVDAVAKRIKSLLPGAEVVTTKALAEQVTGSLQDARNLASRMGGALGAIVLVGAFAIAVLLTLSSVAKRVREIGTLRAIGWSKTRVVGQILSETLGIGIIGGLLGIAAGFGVAAAIGAFSPTLTATSSGVGVGSSLAGVFGQASQVAQTTSTFQLTAPVRPMTMLLGVAFAILGGLLAGAIGGWRAARLSPVRALTNLG